MCGKFSPHPPSLYVCCLLLKLRIHLLGFTSLLLSWRVDIFPPPAREENHLLLVDGKGSSKETEKEDEDEIPQHMKLGGLLAG